MIDTDARRAKQTGRDASSTGGWSCAVRIYEHIAMIPAPAKVVGAAWLIAMIILPILQAMLGSVIFVPAVICTVVLQTGTVVLLLLYDIGGKHAARIALCILISAWIIEFIGSGTGVPFGDYAYTDKLQPQLINVPIVVPLAWLMMLPPAWAVAQVLTRHQGLVFFIVSGFAVSAWDLFLDPQMVMWQFWTWNGPGAYYGIPITNYLGWVFSGAVITIVARPPRLHAAPYLLVYSITWLLQTIGLAFFWNMPGPAIFGFIIMGVFAVTGWTRFMAAGGRSWPTPSLT